MPFGLAKHGRDADAFATFEDDGDEWEERAPRTPVTAPPSPWSPAAQWLPDEAWLHGKQPAGKALVTAERAVARRRRWESSFGADGPSRAAEGVAAAAPASGGAADFRGQGRGILEPPATAFSDDSEDEDTGMREMLQGSPPSRPRHSATYPTASLPAAARACALSEELDVMRLRDEVQAQARSPMRSAATDPASVPRRSSGSLATGRPPPPRHSPAHARSSCSPAAMGCGSCGCSGGGGGGSCRGGVASSPSLHPWGSGVSAVASSWGCRLKVYVEEAELLPPAMVAAAERACGGTARLRVSERGAPHVNVSAESETSLEQVTIPLRCPLGDVTP